MVSQNSTHLNVFIFNCVLNPLRKDERLGTFVLYVIIGVRAVFVQHPRAQKTKHTQLCYMLHEFRRIDVGLCFNT